MSRGVFQAARDFIMSAVEPSYSSKKTPLLGEPLLDEPPTTRSGVGISTATVSLVKTCIGTGVMALPYGFGKAGTLAVPGLVILGFWNAYNCMQLLQARAVMQQRCGAKYHENFGSSYSALMHASLGRAGVVVLEGSVCLSLTLVCASLQVQASQLVAAVAAVPYAICAAVGGIILIPFVLLRSLDGLAWIAVCSLLILAFSLLTVASSGVLRFGPPSWPPPAHLTTPPTAHGFALFFGIASFSFGLQPIIMPVQDGMRHPEQAASAIGYSVAIVVGAYALVGTTLAWLYSSDPNGVQQLVLLNLPQPSMIATVANIASGAVALMSVPMPLMPVVQLITNLVVRPLTRSLTRGQSDGEQSDGGGTSASSAAGVGGGEAAVRLSLLVLTTTLAVHMPQFGTAAGLTGCLCIITSNVLPPLCHLSLVSWPAHPDDRKPITAAFDVLLLVAGAVALVQFTLQFIVELTSPAAE